MTRRNGKRPSWLLRHPRRALAAVGLPIALLTLLGLGLDGRLSPSTLDIPGTQASRAETMLREHFGPSAPFPILLQGPAPALERQGPALIRALRRDPRVTTLSPWDRGSVDRLRPTPRRALIIADFHTEIGEAVKHTVPELDRLLERKIHPPVRATETGFATISRAIQEKSIDSSERAELIALPILLIVLLIVFRSPVAAAIPLAFGAVTVLSSRGLLAILTHWFDVDALALTVCTMMGLALGVDYALLMVSRFREELAAGRTVLDAAATTRRTAGRTTAFAGSTLVLSMVVGFFVVPGALLASLAATLALVVVLSVAVSTVAVPAVLVLLGARVDRWRIGAPPRSRSRLLLLVATALRRPAAAAIVIGAVIVVLAAPALALKTGPLSPGQLPGNDPTRRDYERISDAAGSGFEAPFQIVVVARKGAITEADRLDTLARWQRRIAALPGVETVIGPGQLRRAVAPLHRVGDALLASPTGQSPLKGLVELGDSLGRATSGVATLRAGLAEATYGAGALADGSARAGDGAKLLSAGLSRAEGGATRALASLASFAARAPRLVKAQYKAAFGAKQIGVGINSLIPNLRRNAVPEGRRLQRSLNESAHGTLPELEAPLTDAGERLKATIARLESMTVGKEDPEYGAALDEARQASTAVDAGAAGLGTLTARLTDDVREAQQVTYWLTSTTENLDRLSGGAVKLREGLYRLARGATRVSQVLTAQTKKAKTLSAGLPRLSGGAERLAAGLETLTGGVERLRDGLGEGFHRSYPLQAGLQRGTVRVQSADRRLRQGRERLRRSSPGLFDSGYFVLSALDGAPPRQREAAAAAIDLDDGGGAATMLIFSRYDLNSPGSISLNRMLDRDAEAIGRETGTTAAVAGGPATLNTYSQVARDRIPVVVAAITIATFLVLVLVLRAIPLAALAVTLNLLTVGVAFGILTMLTYVPDGWPLGGRDYIDAVGATMIFGVVFGLSIDYAVFLLVRMREHYDAGSSHAEAITFGLDKTAGVITGAAAIMMAVFIAFGGSSIATVSQLGVGLTIAVLLDATVVRIVFLPALMLLMGERVWWLPGPLQKVLPKLNL